MPTQKSQSFVVVTVLVALILLALIILWPYLNSLVLAIVFAIACAPVYRWILKLVKFHGLASLLTTLLVLLVILVPLVFFGTLVFGEARQLYTSLAQQGTLSGGQGLVTFIKDRIDQIIPSSWGVVDTTTYARELLAWVVGNLGSVFSSIAQGVIAFGFGLLLLFYMLKDWKDLREFFFSHSPLAPEYTRLIFQKIHDSVNAVVRGSLVVAVLQGIATGFGFAIFGIPNPALWGGLAVIAALVPTLGTSLVVVPGILYLGLSHEMLNAIGLVLWGISAVGLLDNFLGPQLVKRGTQVYPLLVLLGVLGGVSVFGPVGFIIGPLVFALLFAVLDIYKAIWQDRAKAKE